jgi:hypothetical protein
MSELTFSQSERRNFTGPILIALAVLAIAGVAIYLYIPKSVATLTITHTAILPTHTVYKSDSKVVGHQDQAQDDLYVLATVHIDNHLRVPLFINDITATLTPPDDVGGEPLNSSAIEKKDLDNLYITFPALKPLASDPLVRESSIAPRSSAEGMVLLHFPSTEADWNNRKSAVVTIDFYHQGPFTVTIPKP